MADLEWHLLTRDDALQRLNVSQKVGLDSEIATRRLKQNGPNQVTPHRPNVFLKYVSFWTWIADNQMGLLYLWRFRYYSFCRFHFVLHRLVSPSLCDTADDRKPLGEPAPQASNLALAVIILVVISIQTAFVCLVLAQLDSSDIQNAWQDFSTGRTMASIAGMLPSDVNVLRDGRQMTMPASDLVVGDLVYVSLGDKVSLS